VYFGRYQEGVLQNEFSGNLIEVCPTGVFTDKTLKKHYTRKWDLTTAPSVCVHCGLGCNIIAGERYGSLRRILSRYNHAVNGYFICDRGRFGYEFVNHKDRIKSGRYFSQKKESQELISVDPICSKANELLAGARSMIGVGSPRASLESNFALKMLVGASNFYAGISETEFSMLGKIQDILQGPVRSPSLGEIRKSDAALVLGEDLTNTAPMMALALREAARNEPLKRAGKLKIPSWQDAAVREFMQRDRGSISIATPNPTKLDNIAAATFRGNAEKIARFGFAIAAVIDSSAPSDKMGKEEQTMVEGIARELLAADFPVIVSGMSLMSEKVLDAAANIAWALHKKKKNGSLAFVVPENNSMGLRMLTDQSMDHFISDEKGKSDLLIILENDLYRRHSIKTVERLLNKAVKVMVLDHIINPTARKADLVIPVGTFAESDGTYVNNEGRAQRFYQIYVPEPQVLESWRWISKFKDFEEHVSGRYSRFDDFVNGLADSHPGLEPIRDIAPMSDYRKNGQKIARETLRYSGRTAMHANMDVNEHKPPPDPDSPLTFSMEGYHGIPPSSVIPFFWSPGWNSQQSINKFQIEVGGPLLGGDPGVRLLEPDDKALFNYFTGISGDGVENDYLMVAEPAYHIFGSEELSRLAGGITELIPAPYVGMSPSTAEKTGLKEGDKISFEMDQDLYEADLKLIDGMADHVLLIPVGLGRWPAIIRDKKVNLKKLKS
jgi:NADH-quinone oxidoreductase subunit G